MRVVFLNPTGIVGGAENVLLNLIRALRPIDAGLKLSVIAGADGPFLQEAHSAGAECQVLELPREIRSFGDFGIAEPGPGKGARIVWKAGRAAGAAIAYSSQLRGAIARLEPDIVHSNGIKFHVLSGMKWVSRAPTLWHVHDFLSHRPLVGRILRTIRHSGTSAVTVSHAVQKDFQETLRGMDVTTVYNAVDTDRFSPSRGATADLDALAGRSADKTPFCRIGLVATYARWKGQEVFLRAAARVLASRPNLALHFYVVGGPIYETEGSQFSVTELRDLSRDLGLGERVSLIPFQRDTAAIYRALDVVVHASTRPEPFGMTIVEAMACGRATVVSNAGGASELFRAGDDAVAVRPGRIDDLADAVSMLALDPRLRERLGSNARTTAVERFPVDRLGKEMLTVYRSLVRDRARTAVA